MDGEADASARSELLRYALGVELAYRCRRGEVPEPSEFGGDSQTSSR